MRGWLRRAGGCQCALHRRLTRKVPFRDTQCPRLTLAVCRCGFLRSTPVQNDLGEFFALVDFCIPGCMGTRKEVRKVR